MLKGLLRVIDREQMDRLHEGILRVLEDTGLHIRGAFLLKALADAGCRVDFEKQIAFFTPELVEKQIAAQRDRYKMVRSSLWYPFCSEMRSDDVAWPDAFTVDFGYGTPWILDHGHRTPRKPTVQDQIDMIMLGNAIEQVRAVNSPLICGDFDPRIETIESARLLLLHTKKPGWVGTSSGQEVKYLAELAALAVDNDKRTLAEQPPVFVNAYCTTSPLKIDDRSCEVLQEALRYGFPVNFASMPILGATTPVTPAGSVIVAAAEILGGITAASLLAPNAYYYGTSISAEMDMRTTQICYSTPAAVLTDAALHQLFRYRYGMVLNVEPAYVEAKTPGLQASFMKTFRQMALGCTASSSLPIGILDNASTFSASQAMIDLDLNTAMYKFGQGIEINDDTMCVDLINELGFCGTQSYLETEHTYQHFRNVLWDTMFLDRKYAQIEGDGEISMDEKILEKAEQAWRELVASQEPIEIDQAYKTELDRIVTSARKELLAE